MILKLNQNDDINFYHYELNKTFQKQKQKLIIIYISSAGWQYINSSK